MRTIEAIADPIAAGVETTTDTMMALVYGGPGQRAWQAKPRPIVRDPGDAVVRITTSTICGTDLHIMKGDVPTVTPGRILGHEGVGVIEAVGPLVSTFHKGDRVLISCISACGICDAVPEGHVFALPNGRMDSRQHDRRHPGRVRPHPACRHQPVSPAGGRGRRSARDAERHSSDRFECGVLNGKVQPGDTVAIVGAGPIGLAALLTAQFYSPAAILMIDLDANRLRVAEQFGATTLINSADGTAVDQVMALTGGAGVDVAIEAVGIPATFDICQSILARGRPPGQHRRPRQARGTASREALGSQCRDHDAAGGHGGDPDAAQARAVGQAAAGEAGHPPVRARRHHEGLRHVRERREGTRAEGHSDEPGA